MSRDFCAGFVSCLFLIVAVGIFAHAFGDTPDIWAVATIGSHHEHDKGYNEQNYGIGIEYGLNSSTRVAIGQYRNSYYKNSVYGTLLTKWACMTVVAQVCAATAAGFVSGYTGNVSQVYRAGLVPIITVEGRHLGANIMTAHGGSIGWVFGLQLKARW